MAGLSINWGAWSDVGAAADRNIGDRIASSGWGEIPPDKGIAALEYLLNWPRAQVGVAPIDWPTYARQFGDDAPLFLSDMIEANRARTSQAARSAPSGATAKSSMSTVGPTIAERVMTVSPGERPVLVEKFVREQVAKVLGIPANRDVDLEMPLVGMGLDSLLAVELRNSLNRNAGLSRRLPATLLFDYPSISALSEHLLALMIEVATISLPPATAPAAAVHAPEAATAAAISVDEIDIAEMTDE